MGPFCNYCFTTEGGTTAPTPTPIACPGNPSIQAFTSKQALEDAVDEYLIDSSDSSIVATQFGHPIDTWCVAFIDDFSNLFSSARNPNAASFNEPIGSWDLSAATDLSGMFIGSVGFDQPIESWNVSSVKSFDSMFFEGKSRK